MSATPQCELCGGYHFRSDPCPMTDPARPAPEEPREALVKRLAEVMYRHATATGHEAFKTPWDEKSPRGREWWIALLRWAFDAERGVSLPVPAPHEEDAFFRAFTAKPCTRCGGRRNYRVDGQLQVVCFNCANPPPPIGAPPPEQAAPEAEQREEIAMRRDVAEAIQRGHPEAAEYYRGYLEALDQWEASLPESGPRPAEGT